MLGRFKFSIFLAGAVAVTAGSCQADEAMLQSPHFATPVASAELDSQRGKALPDCDTCTLGNMSAVVTGNSSVGDLTGSNVIGDGALSNASGAFLAVQNVGNNVVIQTNLSVDVNFVNP
jgi:hypothetical protein